LTRDFGDRNPCETGLPWMPRKDLGRVTSGGHMNTPEISMPVWASQEQ
jgi:hypothetical protein